MSGTALDASVTLEEVFAVVGTKRVPLAPELAGYLTLEIAEHADPNGGDVDPKTVFVGEEGTVALVKPKNREGAGDAETSIRALLGRLLDVGGSQTPALSAASKRKSGSGLPALAEELEAALIPVNRAAGRRALARLAREVRRVTLGVGRNSPLWSSDGAASSSRRAPSPSQPARDERQEPPTSPASWGETAAEPVTSATTVPPAPNARTDKPLPSAPPSMQQEPELPTVQFQPAGRVTPEADVDALIATFGVSGGGEHRHASELKAMAGLDPTPPPRPHIERPLAGEHDAPASSGSDADVEALLALGLRSPVPPPPVAARTSAFERQLPTQPSKTKTRTLSEEGPPTPRRGSRIALGIGIVAIVGGTWTVWELRPKPPTSRTAEPAGSTSARPAPATPGSCKGTLILSDVPPHAEVLLREGQAPVDVERMPVGTRLEFVATAEGYAPKRVVIPAGASWDSGRDGKPRFETAVQLDKSKAHPGTNDPWPAGEPGSEVGGKGPPGTVHVVATPHGAEVWMLAGIGPEARIEQVSCDQDLEVLVAGPTTYRKRLRISASQFVTDETPSPGAAIPNASSAPRVARVDAK